MLCKKNLRMKLSGQCKASIGNKQGGVKSEPNARMLVSRPECVLGGDEPQRYDLSFLAVRAKRET